MFIKIIILFTLIVFACPCFAKEKKAFKNFHLKNKKKKTTLLKQIEAVTYYTGIDYLHKNKIIRIKKGVHFCYNIKF